MLYKNSDYNMIEKIDENVLMYEINTNTNQSLQYQY